MTIEITSQTIITAGALITALTAIIVVIFKFVRWVDRQKAQDAELKELKAQHNKDVEDLKKLESDDVASILNEQQILMYGVLACLKGLKEQGCNGPVTEAINTIEKHLNKRAHEVHDIT